MKKWVTGITLAVLAILLSACGGRDENTVRIGLVGELHYQWYAIRDMVAEEGVTLEFVFFTDFTTPNRALNDGDIELNAFQHHMFFNMERETHGYEISYIAETFIAPLNIFANRARINSLADLRDGHTIALPSDPTNYGRALRLLEDAGILVLDVEPGQRATELDIVEFIVDVTLMPMEANMIAGIMQDVEAGIITNPTAFIAGLRVTTDSIFTENIEGDVRHSLTNVIAVRTADLEAGGRLAEIFGIIARAHNSEEVRQVMLDAYQGALVPVW
ncbi:MAG: MetQ/NlpA family ABC transporter substrate-binding protein [Defluviitaleaceae bacterium]|nr:MetQ/NlpA family ABC transporter substrate-binding protein [Defluviitaleaceae bacterium]MCL2239059.1 MetQ/NlpA family ABC transporter substrate-binding protein [Defluviitaleaceae bacterium]